MKIKIYEPKSSFARLKSKLLIISLVFTQIAVGMNPQQQAAAPDEKQDILKHQAEANQALNAAINISDLKDIVIGYLGVDDGWCLETLKIGQQITSLVLTKDKKYLFAGLADATIQMLEVSTGELITTFVGHKDMVHALALTHDGKLLVSTSADNTIKVWDIEPIFAEIRLRQANKEQYAGKFQTVQCKIDINAADKPYALGYQIIISKNNKYLIFFIQDSELRDGDIVNICDLHEGKLIRSFKDGQNRVHSICLTDNEEHLIIGSFNMVTILDLKSSMAYSVNMGQSGDEVSYIKDSDELVFARSYDYFMVVNKNNKQVERQFEIYPGSCESHEAMVVSKDNKFLFARAKDLLDEEDEELNKEHKINIWDLEKGECIYTVKSKDDYEVRELLISDDNNYIIAACSDKTIKIFKTRFSKRIAPTAEQQGAAGAAMPAVAAAAARAVPNNGGAAAPIEVVVAKQAMAEPMHVASSVVLGEKRESELDLQDQERSKKRQKIDPNDPQEMDDSERK